MQLSVATCGDGGRCAEEFGSVSAPASLTVSIPVSRSASTGTTSRRRSGRAPPERHRIAPRPAGSRRRGVVPWRCASPPNSSRGNPPPPRCRHRSDSETFERCRRHDPADRTRGSPHPQGTRCLRPWRASSRLSRSTTSHPRTSCAAMQPPWRSPSRRRDITCSIVTASSLPSIDRGGTHTTAEPISSIRQPCARSYSIPPCSASIEGCE